MGFSVYNTFAMVSLELKDFPPFFTTIKEIYEAEKENKNLFPKLLAHIIEKDPALSADVLKIANSPLYGFLGEVKSIRHAITLLGVNSVKNMVLRMATYRLLRVSGETDDEVKFFRWLLKKSILNGIIFGRASKMLAVDTFQVATTTGLLMRVGQLYLSFKFKGRYPYLEGMDDELVLDAEEKELSQNMIDTGVKIAKEWNFPNQVEEAIKFQLKKEASTNIGKISYLTNLISSLILDLEYKNSLNEKKAKEVEKFVFELSGNSVKAEHLLYEIENRLHNELNILSEFSKVLEKTLKATENVKGFFEENKDARSPKFEVYFGFRREWGNILLSLSKVLQWSSNPEHVMKKAVFYLKDIHGNWKGEIVFWDSFRKRFIRYFYGDKDIIEEENFGMEKDSRMENAFIYKELEVIHKGAYYILYFPLYLSTKIYGVLVVEVKDNIYSIEFLKFIEIVSRLLSSSFTIYEKEYELKKEINKKYIIVDELIEHYNRKSVLEDKIYRFAREKNTVLLLRSIAHKLNNKLAPILGYSQLLEMKVDDQEILKKVRKISENTDKAVKIVSMMMDYFKPATVEKETVDVNETIKRIVYLLDSKIKSIDAKISLSLDKSIPKIKAEITHIEEIILNLLTNAIEAVESIDGERLIEVFSKKEGNFIVIEVKDSGYGIKEEDISQIFEPFYTTKPNKRGLGLNVVHGILNVINGRIDIDSKPGKGTTIKVSFPFEVAEDKKPVETKYENLRGKVLIVDDDVHIVELSKEILKTTAPEVDVDGVFSGEIAKKMVLEESYDLIVSDIRMPNFSGIDLFYHIKEKGVKSKIIFITGDPFSREFIEFYEKERVEYIKKPFSIMEFSNFVLNKLKNIKEV